MAKTAMTDVLGPRRTRSVGVVLPVHNEERMLRSSLNALDAATSRIDHELPCHIVVVLDDCHDGSATVAQRWVRSRADGRLGRSVLSKLVTVLAIDAGNVGSARRVDARLPFNHSVGLRPTIFGLPRPMLIQRCQLTGLNSS